MGQTELPSWVRQAIATIRRDPRKTGILLALVAVLGFMWIRTFGPGRSRPAPAPAAVRSTTSAGSGNRSVGSSRVAHPRLLKWVEGPVAPVSRNLFAVNLEYFPVERPRNGAGVREQGDDGFWGKLEKSLTLQADQRHKRENQIANYKAQAAQLKLQSTIMGPQPKAMLNGELVGEGDIIASFRVLKIEARRVIVEREGIRLEIVMK